MALVKIGVNKTPEWLDRAQAVCAHCLKGEDVDQAAARILASEVLRLQALAHSLMRTCYDEANRLANHCNDGAARWAMQNLYEAGNNAKAKLPND